MAYDSFQLKTDLATIQGNPRWRDAATRRDFAREVAFTARQEDPEAAAKFVPALWESVDSDGLLTKAAKFTGRAVAEVAKSIPAAGGALAFGIGDAEGLTDTGSGTRFKRGVADLVDATGQRLKQIGSGELLGMNLLPGESKQKELADTLEDLRKDLDAGAAPPGLRDWLAGDYDNGERQPDEETAQWIDLLTRGLATMAVDADHVGKPSPERVREWLNSDRNPGVPYNEDGTDMGPRELLADYVATGDPSSWEAFQARVRETDSQLKTRRERAMAEGGHRATLEAMPEGLMRDLAARSADMQTSPIDLASAVLPVLRGSKLLRAGAAGAEGGTLAGGVMRGAGREALQEGATEYLQDPNADTGRVLEAAALGAVGSGVLEGGMAATGAGVNRLRGVSPSIESGVGETFGPEGPQPERPGTPGGTVLSQIAARAGRVDAATEASPAATGPAAPTEPSGGAGRDNDLDGSGTRRAILTPQTHEEAAQVSDLVNRRPLPEATPATGDTPGTPPPAPQPRQVPAPDAETPPGTGPAATAPPTAPPAPAQPDPDPAGLRDGGAVETESATTADGLAWKLSEGDRVQVPVSYTQDGRWHISHRPDRFTLVDRSRGNVVVGVHGSLEEAQHQAEQMSAPWEDFVTEDDGVVSSVVGSIKPHMDRAVHGPRGEERFYQRTDRRDGSGRVIFERIPDPPRVQAARRSGMAPDAPGRGDLAGAAEYLKGRPEAENREIPALQAGSTVSVADLQAAGVPDEALRGLAVQGLLEAVPGDGAGFDLGGLWRASVRVGASPVPDLTRAAPVLGDIRGELERLGGRKDWVRLAELREGMGDAPRDLQDILIVGMQVGSEVELRVEDDSLAMSAADRAAALRTGGADRHWVRFRAPQSTRSMPPAEAADLTGLLRSAHGAATQGSGTAMVPIADVYAAARQTAPDLTPEAFLDAVSASYDAGEVLLEPSDSPQAIDAAGGFVVRDALGVPGTGMMVLPERVQSSRPGKAPTSSEPRPTRRALGAEARRKLAQSAVRLLARESPELAQAVSLVRNRGGLNEADFHPDDWAGFEGMEGFFDPVSGKVVVFTDQVELRPGETMPRAVARVVLHERIGHAGLAALRENDAGFASRFNRLVAEIEADEDLAAEIAEIGEQAGYKHLSGDGPALVEEWFARQVEAMTPEQLRALKPRSFLGRLWRAVTDTLRRITGRFSRVEWTAEEVREMAVLSREALRRGGPSGQGMVGGRVKGSGRLNPFHAGDLPNWLKGRFQLPKGAPFRVQALGLRAILTGSPLPKDLTPFVRQSKRDIAAIRETAAQLGNDLNAALESYAQRTGVPLEKAHALAAQAMENPAILQAMTDPVLKERTRRARNFLDDLSGAVATFAGGPTGETILNNRGHWMRRAYAAFDPAANWSYDALERAAKRKEKINGVDAAKILEEARTYVETTMNARRAATGATPATPGEIEAAMRQLTDRNTWERNLMGNHQGTGISKDVTSLMRRAAYDPDVQRWMKTNGLTEWDYTSVASLAATGGQWQGKDAGKLLASARAALKKTHPKASTAEINELLRQQDIPAPIRALMGEEVNPLKRFLNSASFQAQFISRHEQQVAMRDLGLEMGLFSREQTGVFTEELGDGRERNGFQIEEETTTPEGQTVTTRRTIYTSPEMAAAMRTTMTSGSPADLGSRLVELLKFIGSEAKLNKVALNPDSWMVNALGNFMGLMQSGDLLSLQGWANVARAIDLHRSGRVKRRDAVDAAAEQLQDEKRKLLSRLTSSGLVNAGLEIQDIEAGLDNRVLQFINEHDRWNTAAGAVRGAILGNGIGRPFGAVGRGIGASIGTAVGAKLGSQRIQQAQRKVADWTTGNPDRFAKIAAFFGNYETHLKAGMEEAEAFELATEKALNTMPDYSKLPDLMRQLSRLGLMGSFIGFQYEVYRNAYWNARYGAQELRSGNAVLEARGARRLIGLSSLMGLAGWGLAGLMRGMFQTGVDDEKDKAYRRALAADYERFGDLAYTRLDEEGASFFNTSYLLPQVTLFEVMKAGMEGRDLGEALGNIAKQMSDQFVQGSVHLDPLLAAWTNERDFGGKVSYETGIRNAAERLGYFMYVTLEPGAINKEDRIVRAIQERGRYGRQFSLQEELKRFLGLRQGTYTHEERIKSRLFRFRDAYDDARALARTAYRQGNPDALSVLERANERIAGLQAEWDGFQADLELIGVGPAAFERIRKAVGSPARFAPLTMGETGPESERASRARVYSSDGAEAPEDSRPRGVVRPR